MTVCLDNTKIVIHSQVRCRGAGRLLTCVDPVRLQRPKVLAGLPLQTLLKVFIFQL